MSVNVVGPRVLPDHVELSHRPFVRHLVTSCALPDRVVADRRGHVQHNTPGLDTWFVFSFFSFPLHLLTAFFSFIHIPPRVALVVFVSPSPCVPNHVSPLVTPQSRHLSHVPPSLRAAPCHTSPIATRHPFAKQVLQKCNTIHCALPHL
jgi:hypothetical protein